MSDSMGDEVDAAVPLLRMFFALPDPLPFPDGWSVAEVVADQPDSQEINPDAWVWLKIHQVEVSSGRMQGAAQAVDAVVGAAPSLPEANAPAAGTSPSATGPTVSYTVVEAVTRAGPVGAEGGSGTGYVADLAPSQDAIMRVNRLVVDYARAYRVAFSAPYGLPVYERLTQPLLMYQGTSPRPPEGQNGQVLVPRVDQVQWHGPQLVMLEHGNLLDPVPGPFVEGVAFSTFTSWMRRIRSGDPFFVWRERIQESQTAFDRDGEYAQAVVLAETAAEVFLDTLLLALMWEEKMPEKDAAAVLEEGKLVRRVKTEWASRLGGTWSLEGPKPVARWHRHSARLRHRVVHGGYRPSRNEARLAIRAVYDLEQFVYDLLATKRNNYLRVTLMTLAETGLRKRDLWGGKIRAFAEGESQTEDNWVVSLRTYRDAVLSNGAS